MFDLICYSFLGLSLIGYGGYTTIKELIKEIKRKRKIKNSLLKNS